MDPLRVWFYPEAIANLMSLFCCLWLEYALWCGLEPGVRRRLCTRELRSLATAGIAMNIAMFVILWTPMLPVLFNVRVAADVWYWICDLGFGFFRAMRFVSVLQETQLALTFLAQAVRWRRALAALNCCIPLVWIVGLALGACDRLLVVWSYNILDTQCEANRQDWVSWWVISTCVIVSLLSCLGLVISFVFVPTSHLVRRRGLVRAASYPLISLVSYTLIVFVYVNRIYSWPLRPLATVLETSNGFLNTFAYSLQSRHARRRRRADSTATINPSSTGFASFGIAFGGVDVLEITDGLQPDEVCTCDVGAHVKTDELMPEV